MGIGLHNGGETATTNTLQDLYREMNANDEQNGVTHGGSDFFPIEFPNPENIPPDKIIALREKIRTRVVALFVAGMKVLKTAQREPMMADDQPTFGKVSPHFDIDDLERAAQSAYELVDPEDPDFCASIADRTAGLIRLLGEIINFANRYDDPRTAFLYLGRFGRKVNLPGGEEKGITEIPWEADDEVSEGEKDNSVVYRKDVLLSRLKLMRAAGFRVDNEHFTKVLYARFPAQFGFIKKLIQSFEEAAERLQLDDWRRVQWLNVLLSELNKVQQMSGPFFEAMQCLTQLISKTRQPRELSAAIDTFVQKTVPDLLESPAA